MKSTILELFPGSAMPKLVLGIETAIAKSFQKDGVAHMTAREVKDRFSRCIKWAEVLRGDMGWGTARIVAAFPDMLHVELSGTDWQPNKRLCWLPSDGA